jgi:hypothetical protein
MTGKDLIIYILQNHLENEDVFKDGTFIGFMDLETAATKFNVGVETIKAWVRLDRVKSIEIGNQIYILKDDWKG